MFGGLPETCFLVLPGEGKLIYNKRGEMGYEHSNWDTGDPEQNRNLADYHNTRLQTNRFISQSVLYRTSKQNAFTPIAFWR